MTATLFDPREWHRVSGYLDQALDREPPARKLWLDELATTEPDLAATLRSLLARCEFVNATGFLEASPLTSNAFAALASRAGEQVGAYTIDRLLGSGGMGEVWLASRSDGLFEGQCAIKFFTGAVTQPKLAERFRHEGGVLARLGHPNIARLFDADATAEGEQFLVLEYVDGVPIDQYCNRQGLSVPARVRLFVDAVGAVAHAHSQLIVHRDLKPSNVLVTREGTVKLLDFGIAKLLSAEQSPGDDSMTRVEEIALTPEYAAPEQLLGEMPSTATDVYQLGMLLYVLLAHGHPLQLHGSRAERVKAALASKLPRASDFATGPLRKQLRGDLDAILGMALNPDPSQRYQTAAALREELLRYLNREPVRARRGLRFYGAGKFLARHRFAATASALALATLSGTLIFALAQARVAANERNHAVSLAARKAAVTEFLGTLITEASEAGKPVTITEMLAHSEKLALADTSSSPENRAAVLAVIGARYGALGNYRRAEQLAEKGLALLVDSHEDTQRAELKCLHAYAIGAQWHTGAAARAIEDELEHLQSDPEVASYCLLYRSIVAAYAGDGQSTLRYGKEGLDRFHAASRYVAADEGPFLDVVAWGYHMTGQNREAEQYYRRAMQEYTDLGREAAAYAIVLRDSWGVVVESSGVPQRALEIHDRNVALIAERNRDEPPPSFVIGNRAWALESLGRYQEARAAYAEEVSRSEQEHHLRRQIHGLYGLASTALALHDHASAAHYLERLTALLTSAIPVGQPPWVARAVMHGRVDLDSGRFEAAREQFTKALGNPYTWTEVAARLGKSEVELRRGDAAAAAEDARLALNTARAMQGNLTYSNYTGLSWLALGRAQRRLGNESEARHAFVNAAEHLSNTVDEGHPALVETRHLLATRFAQAPGS